MTTPDFWWSDQPEPVRAILTLANSDDATVESVLRLFGAAEHVDAVKDIGTDLGWIERLGWDDPVFVLTDYCDAPPLGSVYALADRCDTLAAELREDVTRRAAFIALLIERRAAA